MNPGTAAVGRALQVLAALGEDGAARDGLGVVRLAERVGADKSQLSRTLQTLDEHGFVQRDPDTLAYRLGWRVFALAVQVGESSGSSRRPRPSCASWCASSARASTSRSARATPS